MVADSGLSRWLPSPRRQTFLEPVTQCDKVAQLSVEGNNLFLEQFVNVLTWRSSSPPDRNDLLDLCQRKAQSLGLLDEMKHVHSIRRIGPVTVSAPGRKWKDSNCFVKADRLSAYSSPFPQFANSELFARHISPPELKATPSSMVEGQGKTFWDPPPLEAFQSGESML